VADAAAAAEWEASCSSAALRIETN
jgi:hypothetical protein